MEWMRGETEWGVRVRGWEERRDGKMVSGCKIRGGEQSSLQGALAEDPPPQSHLQDLKELKTRGNAASPLLF